MNQRRRGDKEGGASGDSRPLTFALGDLDMFVRVVERRSMTGAARELGVPKSTVSRAVMRLEDALGARLFRRSSRALSLTEAGRALFDEAQPHIVALRGARDAVAAVTEAPSGPIRLTAPPDIALDVLAPLLVEFVERYPEVRVDVHPTSRTVDLVEEGFDVAIRAGKLRDAHLVARKLGDATLALFAAPSYLARRGTPRTVAELESHDFVLFRPKRGCVEVELVAEGPRPERASVEVRGRIATDDMSFARAAVLAGAGIGLLPGFLAARSVVAGELVRVLPRYCAPREGALYLVHASGRHLPRKIAVLRDFLVEWLGSTSNPRVPPSAPLHRL